MAILSGHHEQDSPPPTGGSSLLELGHYIHIHWDLIKKGSSSAVPLVDKRNVHADVLLRFLGSLSLTSERGCMVAPFDRVRFGCAMNIKSLGYPYERFAVYIRLCLSVVAFCY